MRNVTIFLFLIIGIVIGIVFLQIFLSKKGNKWYGLVLPIISFLSSFIPLSNIAAFQIVSTVNGNVFFPMIATFLVYNIPTVILLVIYFACREKKSVNKELDRMKIDDL